jgi:hypothetical protein
MTVQSITKPSLRERAAEEFKAFIVLALYLYVCLGALLLFKSAILQEAGISFTVWGVAALKALVLAKFMLVGRALHIGERQKHKALIWPTLRKSFVFLLLLIVLTTIEEVAVGLIHHRPLTESLTHVVGATLFQGLATSLIMFLVLVPYFAFGCLGEVLGDRYLIDLFFKDRQGGPDIIDARQRVA